MVKHSLNKNPIPKTNNILALKGPILILGASGFVGSNIFQQLFSIRSDVFGTVFSGEPWRLHGVPATNIHFCNLMEISSIRELIYTIKPQTIMDCSSFGAYSFEHNYERIHKTNYFFLIHLLEELSLKDISAYIHAGSSSEYGTNATAPEELGHLEPNSHYAVSKAAASLAINFFGKKKCIPVINLRLYSVYGPYEDSSRLIPQVCLKALEKKLPIFATSSISRDFIYIDDVVDAFCHAAVSIQPQIYGESFNIGTGEKTTLNSLAKLTKELFHITEEPVFSSSETKEWDVDQWFANTSKATNILNWKASTSLTDGLTATKNWWENMSVQTNCARLTKKNTSTTTKNSVSAVIACYNDAQAIPFMYERLVAVFHKTNIDYEIIFVNDCSPDNSSEIIQAISKKDPNVIGIVHSRNFGSQAAFRSGMELSTKASVVLLDGDLQDPPEIIESFIKKWKAGADVVYGRRIKRDMSWMLECFYKSFYWIFKKVSEIPIPTNAGDFSLIDQRVVRCILACKEKDLYLRGLRAYVGFTQEYIDYIRPERMFGKSTNSWIKNFGWAKKAIFSFTRMPLHLLTLFGGCATGVTVILAIWSIITRMFYPGSVPKGLTSLILLVLFFGSSILLGLGLLGEYIGKIFEETKSRPQFIRKARIMYGKTELDTSIPL